MRHGLPASIIKKYGVSKKAWSVFRSHRRSSTPKRRVDVMPRRRFKRYRPFRSVRRSFRRRGGSLSMKDLAIGAAVIAVVEPTLDTFLDKMIPITVAGIDPKDIGKVAIGWYLLKKSGMVKGIGASLMIVGVRNIARGFAGGLAIGTTSTTNTGGW